MPNREIGFLGAEDFRAFLGFVDALNPFDTFQFVTGNSPLNLTLSLTGLSQDADLYLYHDVNGDGLLDDDDSLVAESTRSDRVNDIINVQVADSGSYIAVVSRFRNSATAYQFRLASTASSSGILIPAEFGVGTLSAVPEIIFNQLSADNTANTYRFTLLNTGNFNAALSGIEAGTNIDMRLIQDANNNGILDEEDDEVIAVASAGDNQDDAINVRSLAPGRYLLQTYLFSGEPSRYTLNLSTTGRDPSNLLPVEVDAGVLEFDPFVSQNFLRRSDAADTYAFTMLSTGNFNAALTGIGFGTDIDMRLIADTNDNGIVDAGEDVVVAESGRNRDDAINVRSLGRGNYILQTYLFSGSSSHYTLSLSNTGPSGFSPSNLLPTEVEVGTLESSPFVFQGAVRWWDAADTYRFTMLRAGNFSAALTGIALGADIDMRLIQDVNNNGIVDEGEGEVLATASAPSNRNDIITLEALAAGNYILQTYLFSGSRSNYTLRLSNTGDDPSNLLPIERNAGTLNVIPYLSFNSLDSLDLADAYRFTMLSAGNFNAALTDIQAGTDIDMRLIQDVNNNGFIDGADRIIVVANAASNRDDAINVQSLAAGRYILQTYLYSGGPSSYTLRLSNTGTDPSNLLPVERDAGVLGVIPYLSQNAIGRRDAADTYRFTMLDEGNFNAALTGIASGTDIDMRLIADVNNNGVIDEAEEVIAIAQAGANQSDFINLQSLAAGNYILQTYLFEGEPSSYTLSLSNTGTAPSNLLPVERNAGILNDTPYRSFNTLSRWDVTDTYSFTMLSRGNFNAALTNILLGTDIDMRLIQDVNTNGFLDEEDQVLVWATAGSNRDDAINVRSLAAGRYILQTYLYSGGPSSYTLRLSNTGPDPSDLLPVERNPGVLGSTPYISQNFIERWDAADTYRFTMLGAGNFNAALTGIEVGTDIDMRLIADTNNNRIVDDTDEVVVASIAEENRDDAINVRSLAAGRYILQTYLYSGGPSSYTLSLSNTGRNPSNLLPVELNVGALEATPVLAGNTLSRVNTADTFGFTMLSAGNFSAALTGIEVGTDIDMRLILDANNNGVVDEEDGEVLSTATAPSNRDDVITIQSLAAGRYILQTYLFSGGPSNYTVRLANTGDDPSILLPNERNIGILDSDPSVLTNHLGLWDSSDTYAFTMLRTGNFNAALTGIEVGTNIDMRLIQDVNNNDIIDQDDRIIASAETDGNQDEAINVQSLTAGRYILQAYLSSGEPSRYTLSLSNTGQAPSNLLPIEQDAGALGTAPVIAQDRLERRDAADTYRFTMLDSGNFNAALTNIESGTDLNMRLIADITNNGVVDEGDRIIAEATAGGNRDDVINIRNLNSGNYILQTHLFSGGASDYTLSLSNTGSAGFSPSNLLAAERSFGIIADPLTRTGTVGVTDAVDTFIFGVTSLQNVTLELSNLQADADLRLIRDFNNNGIVDPGEAIRRSSRAGTFSDAITQTLDTGVYFAQVYLFPNTGNTSYSLSIG